jgi:hypothetical protein
MKVTKLTKDQATELLKLTIQYSQLNERDQKQILNAIPMYREVLTKGKVDYINGEYILTIKD